jgi:hypothetical protein
LRWISLGLSAIFAVLCDTGGAAPEAPFSSESTTSASTSKRIVSLVFKTSSTV